MCQKEMPAARVCLLVLTDPELVVFVELLLIILLSIGIVIPPFTQIITMRETKVNFVE